MDTSDLHYFTAAADAGSFSSAGKALGREPFTLSRRIGGLEDELGLPLFERRHGGVLQRPWSVSRAERGRSAGSQSVTRASATPTTGAESASSASAVRFWLPLRPRRAAARSPASRHR